MSLNEKQVTMITDTIKELIGAGIDAIAHTYIPVETEKSKPKKNRKHREKKTSREDTIAS
jgi:hypothetical protein